MLKDALLLRKSTLTSPSPFNIFENIFWHYRHNISNCSVMIFIRNAIEICQLYHVKLLKASGLFFSVHGVESSDDNATNCRTVHVCRLVTHFPGLCQQWVVCYLPMFFCQSISHSSCLPLPTSVGQFNWLFVNYHVVHWVTSSLAKTKV